MTKIYGTGMAEVRALDGVDLRIETGEFVAIMGPSGSGKSTCLNMIGCLDSPTSGSYRFAGVEVGSLTRNQRALLRRHYLGFVFQGYNLLKRTSALENVEMPLVYRRVPGRERRARAREALAAVGLEGREHHTSAELSGGQQQQEGRLGNNGPGNLDSKTSREIMDLLARLNADNQITVVMVTHEEEMATYAGRIVRFLDGRVVSDRERPAVPTPLERGGRPA